jgi:hypothetical protein
MEKEGGCLTARIIPAFGLRFEGTQIFNSMFVGFGPQFVTATSSAVTNCRKRRNGSNVGEEHCG